jgi:hypothetical protein
MKQAMFLIAKTSLWSHGLAGLHPTPRFEFVYYGKPNFYFILILIDRIILIFNF